MSEYDDAFTALIAALTDAEVDFVLIGGWALPVHGAGRTTFDVDVVPGPERENLARLSAMLARVEAHVPGADPRFDPTSLDALTSGATVKCMTRLGELHVVQDQPGIPAYEDLRARAMEISVEGITFRVCSFEDLVAMKTAAGRPQDEIDIADLKRARGDMD